MTSKYLKGQRWARALGTPCPYCRRLMRADNPQLLPTREHVYPRSKGGRFVIWACAECNHRKGDMLPDEWRAYSSSIGSSQS